MSEEEINELKNKLIYGLQLAEKRMLQEKALHDECVIVQKPGEEIQHIPAKQIIADNPISQ